MFPVSVFLLIFDRVETDGMNDLGQQCGRRDSGERCQIWGSTCI